MNYYIQGGGAASAANIKAAFEELGYDVRGTGLNFASDCGVYFTNEANKSVDYTSLEIFVNLIKTHPDYQELPVETKFKEGDWIAGIDDEGDMATEKIVSFSRSKVLLVDTDGCHTEYPKTELGGFHLWSMTDAKDGDVLCTKSGKCPFIYNKGRYNNGLCYYYAGIDGDGNFVMKERKTMLSHFGPGVNVAPATKGQRDLLFAKMREAGYEWDTDKKELRKTIGPKFKVGDWIVSDSDTLYLVLADDGYKGYQLKPQLNGGIFHLPHAFVDNKFHLWTIADAKDGDVLANSNIICIFKSIDSDKNVGVYCVYTKASGFEILDKDDYIGYFCLRPATQVDKGLLFSKMKEAGYQWDSEKKELNKIQPHYDIANLKAGMPVLVRNDNHNQWEFTFFGRYQKDEEYHFRCADGCTYIQCIPFNDDTKHLLGTTDMCPEEYVNW